MQNENPWYIETAELAEMLFPEAGEIWLASRTPYITKRHYFSSRMTSSSFSVRVFVAA